MLTEIRTRIAQQLNIPVDSIHNTGLPSWVAEIEDLSDEDIESL